MSNDKVKPERDYTIAARRVLSEYGLPTDAQLTVLAASHNHVFQVDLGTDRFVLRFQDEERLSFEARALQLEWLHSIRNETNVCVPDPVPALNNEWIVPVAVGDNDVPRTCVMLRWVDGQPLGTPKQFVTQAVLRRVGETVARLHQHSSSFHSARDACARELDAHRMVGGLSCMADGSARRLMGDGDYSMLKAAAEKIAAAMADLRQQKDQYGLIHADLAPANWVFHDGEPRPIDFDEFGRGFYLQDLLGVLWSHVAWDDYPMFRSHLLAGYERLRPLSPQVNQHADALQAATLFGWFNHGCSGTDPRATADFLRWVPSTVRQVARLCQV